MVNLELAAPVFPVLDINRSIAHYRALGFDVTPFDGDEAYAYARRGAIRLHFWEAPGLDPAENFASAFIYVDDADALAAEWQAISAASEHDCPTSAPIDTDYRLREGAHVDPDGNLMRFAHRL
jgi:hypothetical protein